MDVYWNELSVFRSYRVYDNADVCYIAACLSAKEHASVRREWRWAREGAGEGAAVVESGRIRRV